MTTGMSPVAQATAPASYWSANGSSAQGRSSSDDRGDEHGNVAGGPGNGAGVVLVRQRALGPGPLQQRPPACFSVMGGTGRTGQPPRHARQGRSRPPIGIGRKGAKETRTLAGGALPECRRTGAADRGGVVSSLMAGAGPVPCTRPGSGRTNSRSRCTASSIGPLCHNSRSLGPRSRAALTTATRCPAGTPPAGGLASAPCSRPARAGRTAAQRLRSSPGRPRAVRGRDATPPTGQAAR